MQQNQGCPCCRSALIESPAIEDAPNTDDSEDEDYEDISDDSTIDTDFEDDESDTTIEIEHVLNSFTTRGYDVKDAVSMLLCRYSKSDPKYTKEYIHQLNEDFEDIIEEIETQNRELGDFASEDFPADNRI